MGSKAVIVGTTAQKYLAEPERTVLVIQNMDTVLTDYVYFSHESGAAAANAGIRIPGQGGSLTLRREKGEEPEKAFYLVATTAATPVRLNSFYGKVISPPEGNGGNGETPTPPPPPQTSTCIASAVLPFKPILNVFRHIRTYLPAKIVRTYYRIPYPEKHIWSHFR